MRTIAPSTLKIHLPLFHWAERHGSRPWAIRRIATRHHLPIYVAMVIAEITGIGGHHDD